MVLLDKILHAFGKKLLWLLVLSNICVTLYLLSYSKYSEDISKRLFAVESRFGGQEKLKCDEASLKENLQAKVVRIVGSYSEGSGFPISYNRILTNFHVIDGEPSPKVVFSDGTFVTPLKISGYQEHDLALLVLAKEIEALPTYAGNEDLYPIIGEPVYAAGYPMGTALSGPITVSVGSYGGQRKDNKGGMLYHQTNISLIEGMSGGPLVDACGKVLGINTLGVAGLSLFLDIRKVNSLIPHITEEGVAKITIDTTTPEGTVSAFYSYIKTRNLRKAYELVSKKRMGDVTYEEWQEGYSQTIQVDLINTKPDRKDKNKIQVKFISEDWVIDEPVYKYFEGEWRVIEEEGTYKLNESNIKEITEPGWEWFRE